MRAFRRPREAGLEVHPGKCVFGAQSIDFLVHPISVDSLKPQQDKLAAIIDLLSPVNIYSLRAAIGFFTYFKKFINHFCTISVPLIKLLEMDCSRERGENRNPSFLELKEIV